MSDARERSNPDSPATRTVARWLTLADSLGASDLHLDPGRTDWTLRARIDGVLQPIESLPADEATRALTRIKVISGMLTYRTEIPQDGRVATELAPAGREVRVSTYPTIHGERALLRFLEAASGIRSLAQLGLCAETLVGLEAMIARPTGALLVTGPAGSGKTTTLYTILREIQQSRQGGAHLVSIEDPVEIQLDGVTQTEIHPAVGLDFQSALRALLRHDPDGLLIGEIRDEQTARIAIQASLTGHFVLGTVHASDTVGVFARLLQMGVPAHLLAGAVTGVLSQRLLRLLCDDCKTAPARPVGCEACRHTGYRGRRVVDEWLSPGPALRQVLLEPSPSRDALLEAAIAEGLHPLATRARQLVEQGQTSAEELDRALV